MNRVSLVAVESVLIVVASLLLIWTVRRVGRWAQGRSRAHPDWSHERIAASRPTAVLRVLEPVVDKWDEAETFASIGRRTG
jgi:hypothetical protein